MIAPHSSCRYVVGIHHGAPGTTPRTFLGAVHAIPEPQDGHSSLLVSRVDVPEREGTSATFGLPRLVDGKHFQAMAPNLGEARKMLHAMLAAGGGDA